MLSTSFTFTRARNYSSQPSGSAENMSTDSGSLTLYNICNSIHSCLSTNSRPNAFSHSLKQIEGGSQCCEILILKHRLSIGFVLAAYRASRRSTSHKATNRTQRTCTPYSKIHTFLTRSATSATESGFINYSTVSDNSVHSITRWITHRGQIPQILLATGNSPQNPTHYLAAASFWQVTDKKDRLWCRKRADSCPDSFANLVMCTFIGLWV